MTKKLLVISCIVVGFFSTYSDGSQRLVKSIKLDVLPIIKAFKKLLVPYIALMCLFMIAIWS